MSRKKSRSRKTNTSKQTVKPAVRQSGAIPFQLNAEQRELAANIKEEASEPKQVTEEIIPELMIGEPEGKRKSDADDLIIEDVIVTLRDRETGINRIRSQLCTVPRRTVVIHKLIDTIGRLHR